MIAARLKAIRVMKRERAAAVKRLLAGSVSGDSDQVHAALDAIERAEKALAAITAPRWGIVAAVGIISAAVATALIVTPITAFISLPIAFTVESRLVRFETERAWSLGQRVALGPGRLDIRGVSTLQERGLGLNEAPASRALALESDIRHGAVTALGVAPGSRILLERTPADLTVYGLTGSVDARLQIPSDAPLSVVSGGRSQAFGSPVRSNKTAPPLILTVAAEDIRGVPMMLQLPLRDAESIPGWSFHVADYLDFVEDPTTTGGQGQSAIRSGAVRFPGLGLEQVLDAGDTLALAGPRGRLVVEYGADGLSVTFRGEVSGAETGWSDTRSSLVPSTLDYLYRRKPLEVLWTAILFIGGLVWSVGRLLSS